MSDKYSTDKHEWGTDAGTKLAKDMTPGENKKMKRFKEFAQSADKVPQNYRDPETGKTKVRMVPKDKEIIKKEEVELDEVTSPEIKAAYADVMKTKPRSPERKAAIQKYQKLRLQAIDDKKTRKEEVEQVDELKKSTLGSYIKKASDDRAVASRFSGENNPGHKDARKIAAKRKKGIAMAADKLAREEVEQTDESKKMKRPSKTAIAKVMGPTKNIQQAYDAVMKKYKVDKETARTWVLDVYTDAIKGFSEEVELDEKSVSQAQQKFFGMVRAKQKGEMDNASPAVAKAAKSMSKKDVKDFAATKHKGLPKKKDED